MRYRIRHTTRFEYSDPIRESVMELRMQPRTDAAQRCLEFSLALSPEARFHHYTDYLGNVVHHFDIPSVHQKLEVVSNALVDSAAPPAPSPEVSSRDWAELDALRDGAEHWDWLHPSFFAQPSDPLAQFAEKLKIRRRDDPLTVLKDLNIGIGSALSYESGSTRVDSPIDDCLKAGKGVCQDFAHIFIAIARGLGIPTRYVSGYLFHRLDKGHGPGEDATHAWVEAFVPGMGWIGFDPSNRAVIGPDHVRVAMGRDYLDVPPTRGVFRGTAVTRLTVHVDVLKA